MKYDTKDKIQLQAIYKRLDELIIRGKIVELTEVRKSRTNAQNKYLHALFGIIANELGYECEEIKDLAKFSCPMMKYQKKSKLFFKSTSKLNTKEMSEFTDWIRNWGATMGVYLPSSEEYYANQFYIDNQINRDKYY